MKRLKILTWHIHGSYLFYLTHIDADIYLPIKHDGSEGKTSSFSWGKNVYEITETKVKETDFDVIIFQSNFNPAKPNHNYLADQMSILSSDQLANAPKIFIEHDLPRMHPTDTKHIVDNSDWHLVHVTHFNDLMWDSGQTPTTVIDHGVTIPSHVSYTGEIPKGVVVINNIKKRGRRLGFDVFEKVRKEIPLDVIGMGSEEIGGIGEIEPQKLPEIISTYRFFFSPIRYTSLGLSTLEAMMVGLPVIGLATTELTTVIRNGINGYIDTNIDTLIPQMKMLLDNPQHALELSKEAKKTAEARFSIQRFVREWQDLLTKVLTDSHKHFTQQPYARTTSIIERHI